MTERTQIAVMLLQHLIVNGKVDAENHQTMIECVVTSTDALQAELEGRSSPEQLQAEIDRLRENQKTEASELRGDLKIASNELTEWKNRCQELQNRLDADPGKEFERTVPTPL